MAQWLVKSDPAEYSAADLARGKRTLWAGVRNATAQLHLRAMKAGDEVLIYHTGREKVVVAIAFVQQDARPDPTDATGKSQAVELAFKAWVKLPVTLATIKADPAFAEFDLVRIGRLSVMPVPAALWKRLVKLAGGIKS